MVDRFHAEGLEVILDVVYNHTPEGNELGPTLSFKGIDNASYYRLLPDEPRYYINDTGTGNTVNLSHPRVLQMVTDSLRYWVTEMHVDGFRFDLAPILAREPHGFDEGGGFLDSCRQDPVLSSVKLIAEPWECGPAATRWAASRPAGPNGTTASATRCARSGRATRARRRARALRSPRAPTCSTSAAAGPGPASTSSPRTTASRWPTWCATTSRHNEANSEDNRDGHADNRSWNCGVEGPTDDPAVLALRARQQRNLLATLLLAQGTPMLLAGDEFGRTPARQQQRLLPGRRDLVGRLADDRPAARR